MTIQTFPLRYFYMIAKCLLKASHFKPKDSSTEKGITKIVTVQIVNKATSTVIFFNLLTNCKQVISRHVYNIYEGTKIILFNS